MTPQASRRELSLIATCLALVLLALLGPAISQPADHHHFADQRTLWGIACAALFFGGLVVTATCSAWYHLQPNDAGLVIDRLGMVFAFAGLLGLAVAGRISERAGLAVAALVLVLGPLSVQAWAASGNVLAWCVLQFGGMALMLWLATLRPLTGALGLRLGAILLIYAAAKALELADHAVFDLTGQLVSGHTLKHVLASLAALPVIAALRSALKSGQNPAAQDKTKVAPARWLGNA